MGNRMSNIATPMPQIRARFTSKLGIPLSGCKVYTYEPNSNIPKATWIDVNKTVENTNPILLDAAGEADIFLDGLYQIVVKDRFGFVVYDVEKTGISLSMLIRPNGQSVETSLVEIDAVLDTKASNEYVDNQLSLKAPQSSTYTKAEVDTALALKAPQSSTYTKAEVDTTLAAYVGGRKAYTTLALAQADQVNLPASTAIEVTNDPTSSNNGTYQWDGTTLTKSSYDPLTQAKADATNKANEAESNAKSFGQSYTDSKTSVLISDVNNNLAKTTTWAIGKLVSHTSNSVLTVAGYAHSDYIAVNARDLVEVASGSFTSVAAFYDSSKTWLGGQVGIGTSQPVESSAFRIPVGTAFIRVNASLTAHPDLKLHSITINKSLSKTDVTGLKIRKEQIEGYNAPNLNLFKKENALLGSFVDQNTGAIRSNYQFPTVISSAYIEVKPSTTYVCNFNDVGAWLAMYDENKAFIIGYDGRATFTFTTTAATKYVVMNLSTAVIDTYTLTEANGPAFPTFDFLEPRLQSIQSGGSGGDHNSTRFAGKTLLVSGDSITEKNVRANLNWHDYLKTWHGLAAVQNDAVSGSGLIKAGNNIGMCYRLTLWPSKYTPDLIMLMGNMNDGTSEVTGDWSWIYGENDIHKDDWTSVVTRDNCNLSLWFALRFLFEDIILKYPNIPIGYIISQPRAQTAVKSGTARAGYTTKCWGDDGWFSEWCDVIERVAAHYSIPVLNLYKNSNMRPWNTTNNNTYFSPPGSTTGDGIHPNDAGQELMAQKISEFMKQFA